MSMSLRLRVALGVSAAIATYGASPVPATNALLVAVQSLQQNSQKSSPGLSQAIDILLGQLDTMTSAVAEHYGEIQSTLNSKFATLSNATTHAEKAKDSAVPADTTWVGCVAGEKIDLAEVETAQQLIDNTVPVRDANCQTSDAASRFSVSLAGTELSCDQRDHSCSDRFNLWTEGIGNSVGDVDTAINNGVTSYKAKKLVCDTAKELVQNQTTAHGLRDGEWINKRADCHDDDAERVKDICAYGYRLQEKCSAEYVYIALLNEVMHQTNKTYSLADLQAEWSVIKSVRCMLTALKVEGKVLSTTDCEASGLSLQATVGAVITNEEGYNAMVAAPKAKCQTSITFSGQKWTFPKTGASTVVKSIQYVNTAPWVETFRQTGAPFDMCQAR